MDLHSMLIGSDSLRFEKSIAALNQFRRDADGDLTRLVCAHRQPDWAAESFGHVGRDAAFAQFSHKHFPLGLATDHAEIARLNALLKNRLQNRPIRFMTHCHAKHIVVGAKLRDEIPQLGHRDGTKLWRLRQLRQPILARIDADYSAFQQQKQPHKRLSHMPRSKHDDAPIAKVIRLKQQLYHASASHPYVALQIPINQLARRRAVSSADQQRLGVSNRLILYSPAPDRAEYQPALIDQHLR